MKKDADILLSEIDHIGKMFDGKMIIGKMIDGKIIGSNVLKA